MKELLYTIVTLLRTYIELRHCYYGYALLTHRRNDTANGL